MSAPELYNLLPGHNLFCTVCTAVMPEDRLRRGCTECSPACKQTKRRIYRRLRNARKCQYCGRGIRKANREKKAAAQAEPSPNLGSESS